MSNPSKNKGSRFEREVVELARAFGLSSKRVPLSGAAEGYPGDVIITASWGADWCGECKIRKGGLKFLYDNLKKADVVFYRTNHSEPLAILGAKEFMEILAKSRSVKDSSIDPTGSQGLI